jgi:hypothetical protein
MESTLKNPTLRILISSILLSLISGIVVSITGLMLKWNTSLQFSDGFFWAGVIIIILGFISFQGYRQRTTDRLPLHLDPAILSNLWAIDTIRGKYIMIFFGISGLLLLVMSYLVFKLY